MPKLLKNTNRRFALVSLTKYQTKIVRSNLVTIAGIINGFTMVIMIFIINDHNTNGL